MLLGPAAGGQLFFLTSYYELIPLCMCEHAGSRQLLLDTKKAASSAASRRATPETGARLNNVTCTFEPICNACAAGMLFVSSP